MAIGAGIILPSVAHAAALDELNSTLTKTMSDVTSRVANPLNQVQSQVQSQVQQVQSQVQQTIGGVTNTVNSTINNAIGGLLGNNGSGGMPSFLNPFQSLVQQFNSFLSGLLGGGGGAWNEQVPGGSANSAATAATQTGALGLPDFAGTRKAIDQLTQANSPEVKKIDAFNVNPVALSTSWQAQSDREQSRGVANTITSKEGQQKMAEEAKGATQALNFIQTTAAGAQKKDVTQDVMKDLAAMNSAQSGLQAGSYAQLMGLRQQTAANSVVTSNISEGIDERNRMEHAERYGTAISVLNAASNLYVPGQSSTTGSASPTP